MDKPRKTGSDGGGMAGGQGKYVWMAVIAALVVGIGYLSWNRLAPGPAARPAPSSKWTAATEEPDVRVYISSSGAIETMPLEKYIEGVVAAEMEPTWPLEALKAQAIAARSFTIQELDRRGGVKSLHPGADVSTNPQEFLAYNPSRITDNVRLAVKETRGQILTYQGRPVWAIFHADAGGQTATAAEALGGAAGETVGYAYLRSVRAPWMAPNTEWTASFSRDEIRAAATRAAKKDPGPVTAIAIGTKGPSGRAMTLVIGGAQVPAPELRLALGSTRMRSTLLTWVGLSGDKVTMKGRGYGHGLGLAQWAARGMAAEGRKAEEIVAYFYRGARTVKLWP
jgi:stage II sporulation protein D